MASRVVLQGLQRIADTASQTSGYSSARYIRTMSWDIGTTGFAAGHTKLNDSADVGATSNTHYFDQAFGATPTRSAEIVSHVSTLAVGDGNFLIKRVALHDDTAANVTNSSTTLVAGVDGQSLTKTSDFTLATTLSLAYTNV